MRIPREVTQEQHAKGDARASPSWLRLSLARTFSHHSKWRACSQNKFQYSYSRTASRQSRDLGYLDSFMRGAYMLIAYHLSSDKSRQTILHSCANPNRLPSTASIIKMCPHLHVHKKKHSSLHSAQNLQFCELSQSRTANLPPLGPWQD